MRKTGRKNALSLDTPSDPPYISTVANFSPFWRRDARANGSIPRLVFTDATDPRILTAIERIRSERIASPILVGQPEEIARSCREAGLPAVDPALIAPLPDAGRRERDAQLLLARQSRRGATPADIQGQLNDSLYQGIAMLLDNRADGMIAGSLRPTADVVRAALQCIGPKAGQRFVAGHFLIETERLSTTDKTPFLFADCAVMPEPSPRALAAIAVGAAASYRFFTGQTPRVALLSFSTRGSAEHELVDRIREALTIIKGEHPDMLVDGEIQVDAAVDLDVARIKKASDSEVTGRANVFVFPTLEAGHIGYKLVQRFGAARVAGPLLWGLDKPVSDLSRGCTADEVADTAFCVSAMTRGMN